MNFRHIINICTILAISTLTISCAEEKEEDARTIQERILKSYINANYPDAKPSASGLYIVDSTTGNGRAVNDSSYLLADYTIRYLDGTYISYCSEDIAHQLGTYSNDKYYGYKVWNMNDITEGIKEVTTGIKEGGSRKAVIPSWLLNYDTDENFVGSDGSNKIYDIKVINIIDDIIKYETDQLDAFAKEHYPKEDSTNFGYYYKRTKAAQDPKDTIRPNETVYFTYIGKYLDGKVFDTNIADTAKKYGIYNGKLDSYKLARYTHKREEEEAIKENKYVKGFTKTLWRMKYGEHAATFFYSGLGYGSAGNSSIPGYMPLYFEIFMEDKKKTDD